MIDFGLPAALAAPLSILLPVAELAVAVALLPASTAFWGAVGAFGLLLLFVAGIGANLARGRKPDCHCFGQLHSAPAGRKTLARNGVLAALAGFLVWQGWKGNVGPGVFDWIAELSTTQLVGLGLLAGQWWLLLHLLRQNRGLRNRLETLEDVVKLEIRGYSAAEAAGLPVGARAPAFTLQDLHGENVTLDSLRVYDKPVILLFVNPGCGPCNTLLPEIGRWQKDHADELTLAVVSRGGAEENRVKVSAHGLANVLLQEDWEVAEAYQARGAPSAVLILPDGAIGSPVASSPEAIEELVTEAVNAALIEEPHK
jgi:thiol-disulfide isomerase/thioredoxin